jgi:hypothetical protein
MEQTVEQPTSSFELGIMDLADLLSMAKQAVNITDPRGITGCCQDCACEDSTCPQN